jgi:hypothetical protein
MTGPGGNADDMTAAPATPRPSLIVCGQCGRRLGSVTDTPSGRAYHVTAALGGTASGPGGMWCPEHGWPDLAAVKPGRTLRARMTLSPPIPR